MQGKNPYAPGRGICCANSCPLPRAGRGDSGRLLCNYLILAEDAADAPGRNAVRPALALEHDEGGVVLRALFRVQAETVRKINETAQRVERALSDKLVDVLGCAGKA